MDEKLGRMVTRVVLPHVVMHSRYHYGVIHFYDYSLRIVFDFEFYNCGYQLTPDVHCICRRSLKILLVWNWKMGEDVEHQVSLAFCY